MSLAAVGIDWVTPEEATWLVHLCWLAVVIVVAGWRTESPSWKTRAKTAERENLVLRLELAAPRNQPGARHRPRELHEWPEPTPPARERHWTSTLWWPGCRGSALPLEYGATPLDGSRLDDPCLRTPAPTDAEVLAWRLEDQPRSWPLDAVDIAVAWFADEIEAANTQQMETARG